MTASGSKPVELPVILNSMQEMTTDVMEGMTSADYYPEDLAKMYFSDEPEIDLHLTLGGTYFEPQLPRELKLLPPTPVAPFGGEGVSQLHLRLASSSSPDPLMNGEMMSHRDRMTMKRIRIKNRFMEKKLMENISASSSAINSVINGAHVENMPAQAVAAAAVMPQLPPAQPAAKEVITSVGNVPHNRLIFGPQLSNASQHNTPRENGRKIVLGNTSSPPVEVPVPVPVMIPVPGHRMPVPVSWPEPKETPILNIAGSSHDPMASGAPVAKRVKLDDYNMIEIGGSTMRSMHAVSTTGGIPNGRIVEGILYVKYPVCLVCICHGKFFTPAEFVKHAGGGDIEKPLKYIKVSYNCQ